MQKYSLGVIAARAFFHSLGQIRPIDAQPVSGRNAPKAANPVHAENR
jgi:hypothetical protein